jgi:hypothetical protein
VYRDLVGDLRERDHWGDPGEGGRIMLRWISTTLLGLRDLL